MKRKLLLSTLAVIPAMLMPLAAMCQVAPDRPRAERTEPTYKYEVFAGFGYTSLNQVNQSRYGLIGVNIAVTRDFGRYFGITADGAYYGSSLGTGNPGKPTVDSILGGPVLHAPLYGKVNGFVRALLGGEHTGGEGMTPSVSFAGGAGGGLEYVWSPHLVIRASGDDIASSFSVTNNTPQLGYSANKRWNSRATIGVAYRF
ncbi:MAG TPA: hypothetical protein VGG85_02295 [Terracidiphilus sp.]